jgi:hypothetical protein
MAGEVLTMKPENTTLLTQYELIDGPELAARWKVTASWVRKQCAASENCLPHLKLGRYVRFLWGSPDLCRWMESRYQK